MRGYSAPMRPGAVAAVALVSAVLGVVGALSISKAAGWVGDTETIVIGTPAPRSGDPAAAPLKTVAKPLISGSFDPARIYAARANGVVTIYSFFGGNNDAQNATQGSGFVVSTDGLVLTNSHVVTNAGEGQPLAMAKAVYAQFHDGDRVKARIVGYDPFTDVAVVRLSPKDHALEPVPLADSARVVVGEPVAAIGSPFGNETSLAVGVVSATRRSIESLTSIYNVVDAIQTDAPINRGNSGGPLFDARGRVIGINAQIRSDSGANEGVGFAIPINAAKRSLEQLVATGSVHYAYVGVRTADLTPSLAKRFGYTVQRGAVISDVNKNSPAAKADLRPGTREEEFNGVTFPVGGDVIVEIDGLRVRGADDVVRYVSDRLRPGDVSIFTVIRAGREHNFAVTLGERPLPR
jgi:S1-C subfamily serine protease